MTYLIELRVVDVLALVLGWLLAVFGEYDAVFDPQWPCCAAIGCENTDLPACNLLLVDVHRL